MPVSNGIRVLELQANQSQRMAPMAAFAHLQMDELKAIIKLAADTFGRPNQRYRDDFPGADGGWRYGGLVEANPKEPGVVYIGYYKDPPTAFPQQRRRRLPIRGVKVSDLEAQVRVWLS